MSDRDYYETLKVPTEASQEMIKRAYRILALKYHPDRYPLQSRKQAWAEERFKELQEAYEVLRNPLRRREYDEDFDEDEVDEEPAKTDRDVKGPGRDGQPEPREAASEWYRRAQDHYARASRCGFWRLLFGVQDWHLRQARAWARKLIREHPESRLIEESHLLYLRTLMEVDRYDRPYLEQVNGEIERFMRRFPTSPQQDLLRYHRARFALFKKDEPRRAAAMFKAFLNAAPRHEMAAEARACLKVAQELLKR